ncbi:Gldg family protein [Parapedobacter koreensis]|uniref:ABC-2 type transport system permease protein n=1 Tax=Parapedobacter koreensis TaxID=332977 RepID=A0A1H7U742_9SPHI|nr:Gldg family protein [Parapedobacter koreensis]SEL92870.1 ABC-2 type transport system permease protein [Parapedobacter koreensis]
MGKVYRIAGLELKTFFYAPVAWLLLVVFAVQAGLVFADLLGARIFSQQLGGELPSLTQDVFGGSSGLFATMQRHLYLYMPLLTMGLVSREVHSGSIKLLLSAPVTTRQLVFGKYVAMLVFGLLFVVLLLAPIGVAGMAIPHLDRGYLAAALLGLYLLLAAYAAIGLYVSSLTRYQAVAAIGTLAVLAGLNYVGEVGSGVDVVRDITYWFSMRGRTGYFLKGLISSKDVCYFLLVISLFITLTSMKLDADRAWRAAWVQVIRYGLLLLVVVGLGYASSRPGMQYYADATRYATQSFTQRSKEIIARVDERVQLTTYVNLLGNLAHIGSPRFRNFDQSNLEQIRRYLPQLERDYVYFYDTTDTRLDPNIPLREQALRRATAYGFDMADVLPPSAIRQRVDLSAERNQFVRLLTYRGKTTPLRMFHDIEAYPGEAEVIAAVKRLLDKPLTVGMLTGHAERSPYRDGDKDYPPLMTALNTRRAWINQGAEVTTLEADSPRLHPDSLDVLILADPLVPYTGEQLANIQRYIALGGNLLLAGEPGRQAILNTISEPFGVRFAPGKLLQESKDYEPDLIQARFSGGISGLGFSVPGDTVITMPGAVGLVYRDTAGFVTAPVLETDGRYTWNRTASFDLKTGRVVFDPAVDRKQRAIVAVATVRQLPGKEQRIVVTGDADFLSKGEWSRYNVRTGNAELGTQLLRWFSHGEYPPDTRRPAPIDNRIRYDKAQFAGARVLTGVLLPSVLALGGTLIIIRRRRK